ncbi:MAG: redoxin domain-containing protein [Alphaproteobacteria bacterium]|nr:redoxin domain-containing protein [Alphaproteobacteria bacterium]
MTFRWPTLFLLAATVAFAEPADPRGWSPGQKAAGAARILAGPDREGLPELELPKAFAKQITGRTLLFYFSPTCPHCMKVGKEVGDLARALKPAGVEVIGVATGSSLPADVQAFRAEYGLDFPVEIDEKGEIGSAIGARSTPSALLVEPGEKGKQRIVDVWYPYQPGYDIYVRIRAAKDPWSVFGGYLGNGSCVGCHQQESEGWALTHHSVAWRTLTTRGKDTDPECVSCHVTGAGKPGGWSTDRPDLTGVGCEACHGPSGPHDGVRDEPKDACATCHDAKHSIRFSLERAVPLIDHYAANAMDDETFRARRMAVVEGQADRSLVAFPTEPTVGAEACKSCHEAEYAQWAGSPHHHAMQTLRDAQKEGQVDCVRCHATPTRGGPTPTELSGFRVAEAVGCEACHGPGQAHVEAKGGTENIEKLGDDCPVCVIEAVCTSCHTSEQDPDWNLEKALPKAGHGAR